MPLSDKPYHDKVLFPFFDGLIPEGWLLDIAEKNWKIDVHDSMSLLMMCCKDCIGAVGVEPITEEMALTLNGKKRRIKKTDFVNSMRMSGLENKVIENIFNRFHKVRDKWFEFIDISFIPDVMKKDYKTIIEEKLKLLS